MSNQIVNEILLSKLYQIHAFQILVDFISEKNTPADVSFLENRFQTYEKHELLFQFEYADGAKNTLLNSGSTNLLLMPFRGIISVLLLLSCMTGAFMEYADRKTGFPFAIGTEKKVLYRMVSLLVPAFFSGSIGIFSIYFTEISEALPTEIIAMLCYLFACTSLTFFLSCFLKNREAFLSFLPVFTAGSLLVCPVFFDISIYSPVIKILRFLSPVHYYLRSLHSTKELFHMLLYGIILLIFRIPVSRRIFKTDFQKL